MEEKKKSKGRTLLLVLMPLLILGVYVLRLYDWQILNGAEWLATADHSTQTVVPMEAARGEILDCNGNPLAVNKTSYSVVFNWLYMKQETSEETVKTENATILSLIQLLDEENIPWLDTLPITIDKDGNYQFKEDSDREINTLKGKDYADVNSYASAEICMQNLIEKYQVEGYSKEETRDIVSVRYNMVKEQFSISSPYTFAEDIPLDLVTVISENSSKLPGVTVDVTTTREYYDTSLIPQIVGQMGKINSLEEYNELKDKGYSYDDLLGRSGIEGAYEDTLRGKAGEKLVETTSTGQLASETVTKAPEAGSTIYLTIDSNLQRVANASLEKNIKATRENGERLCAQNYRGSDSGWGEDCWEGGAVVLDVKTGGVLAAGSAPGYDGLKAQEDSNYYASLLEQKGNPLVNKAFSGTFTPGSCFKPVVACAALEEGCITNSTVITCRRKYDRFENDNFHTCLGYHGPITLRTALAKSCNVFFYETGYRLGIDALNLYCQRFGLGVKTGVETGESAGILAGPETKNGVWRDGDTLNAAIGQSDYTFTPLQLATMAATIANDGTRLKTTVIKQITDYTRTEVLEEITPTVADTVEVSQENIDYVKDGMEAVVTEGTAETSLGNYPVKVAGKTGTAQTNGSDNVVFVGYAPADNPEIAVAVVLDHGATSSYCQNVVVDILNAYFYDATVDEEGNIVVPSKDEGNSGSSSAE